MNKQQNIQRLTAGFAVAILFVSLLSTGCQMILPSGVTANMMQDGTQRGSMNRNANAQNPQRPGRRIAQNEPRRTPQQGVPKNQSPTQPVTNGQGEVQTVAYQMPDQNLDSGVPKPRVNEPSPVGAPVEWSEEMAYSMAPGGNDVQIYESGPGTFRSNAVQTLPQSATEKLIQLSGEMMIMRQEMQMLQQSVQELRTEKSQLMEIRQELNTRLNSMEARLEEALENEANARSKYDDLSQRVQIFNDRRQKQISELNQIIDQLETQLRRPATSSPGPPPSPNITDNQTRNRTSYRGRNGLR